MQMNQLLRPEAVRTIAGAGSKKRLFQEIAEMLGPQIGVAPSDILEALVQRESLGATGMGGGVAIPHARLEGLDRVVGGFLRLEKPLDYGAVDREPVDLVFALLAPRDSGVDHLKALALVSRTLRNPMLCTKLRANTDPGVLFSVLTEATASKAA